jgi:hypothetical protein
MTLQVVTANRLTDGRAVFYSKEGEWHNSIDLALSVEGGDSANLLLEKASSGANKNLVVGPYLIDVTEENGRCTPTRYREMIRTRGPSVRPDLGYQAQ